MTSGAPASESAANASGFPDDVPLRKVQDPEHWPFTTRGLALGHGLDQQQDLIRARDAIAARFYAPTERQVAHAFEASQAGWDHETRIHAAPERLRAWKGKRG